MRTVWKFVLGEPVTSLAGVPVFGFEVPVGGIVLDVQLQGDEAVFWVDVDTDEPCEMRRFVVVGTGRAIPPFATEWEGTWQHHGLVWHLYSVDEVLYRAATAAEAAGEAS